MNDFQKQIEFLRSFNRKGNIAPPSLIDIVIRNFSSEKYPDDFKCYTQGAVFDVEAYKNHLKVAYPLLEMLWERIETVACRMREVEKISWDDALQLVGKTTSGV